MKYEVYEGKLDASGKRFALVVSRFNNFFTDKRIGNHGVL